MSSTSPAWPSFTGTAQLVGTSASGRATIYVDPTLGDPGLANANALLADADRIIGLNDAIFGTNAGAVSAIVAALGGQTDGTGGADHLACNYQSGGALELDAAFGQDARVSGLFEAELSECNMGGNLCGSSTGEALSRWCASVASNNALSDFATAPTWFQQGAPDWVTQTEATDQDPVSTGCGMAVISWLLSTGQSLPAIAQALVSLGAGGTWALVYATLTGDAADNALPNFTQAVQNLPGGITSDDPFGGFTAAAQSVANAPPATAATSGATPPAAIAEISQPHSHRLLPPGA